MTFERVMAAVFAVVVINALGWAWAYVGSEGQPGVGLGIDPRSGLGRFVWVATRVGAFVASLVIAGEILGWLPS